MKALWATRKSKGAVWYGCRKMVSCSSVMAIPSPPTLSSQSQPSNVSVHRILNKARTWAPSQCQPLQCPLDGVCILSDMSDGSLPTAYSSIASSSTFKERVCSTPEFSSLPTNAHLLPDPIFDSCTMALATDVSTFGLQSLSFAVGCGDPASLHLRSNNRIPRSIISTLRELLRICGKDFLILRLNLRMKLNGMDPVVAMIWSMPSVNESITLGSLVCIFLF
mmetsp:Transcript_13749/g.20122  ORF Transcript_13749/g.20122 Transcript_13749/m.20122 type:complete len:222 (+) Transcript_13749:111-776(+)